MEHNESVKNLAMPAVKKEWSDPEIVILAINEATMGGVLINDDGGSFSS